MNARLAAFRSNPIMAKELRGRMRGGRAFIVLTAYLLLLCGAVSILYLIFLASSDAALNVNARQTLGKAVFGVVVSMQLLSICFIAPAITAGAISAEREGQTFDLLRSTLLSPGALVSGKLMAALGFIFLLLFAALPLQSLAFLFGGIAIEEVILSAVILSVTAIAFSAVGLFFSSFSKRTLVSTVLAYAFAILLVFGLPIMMFLGVSLLGSFIFIPGNRIDLLSEVGLIGLGWFLVSINPIATAVATELMLIEQQTLLYITFPLSGGNNMIIISPWISYTAIYLLLSVFLIWLSIRFVGRVER